MTEDNRDGRDPRTGTVVYGSGDTGTAQALLAPRPEVSVSLSDIIATYSSAGGTEAVVQLHDAPATAAVADLTQPFMVFHLSADDEFKVTGGDFKDIVAGLVVVIQNNDGDIALTANGVDITG